MVVYHRWFLLPLHEYTDDQGNTTRAPRYVFDEDRIDGYTSGGPFTPQQVKDAGYATLTAHNNTDEWRVVVTWGEGTDAWNALNEIHANYLDTDTLADYQQDVAPVLDNRFGEGNWSVNANALSNSENNA